MTKLKITDATTQIFDLLTDLTSEERKRAVHAALMLLGETPSELNSNPPSGAGEESSAPSPIGDAGFDGWHTKAIKWAKLNGLTQAQHEQVFHVQNGAVEIIAVPGNSKWERSLNCYILQGVASLIATGEVSFEDKTARGLCVSQGSYDTNNHARMLKDFRNRITGSKQKGWQLTTPGLKYAAELIKALVESND